MIQRFLVRRIGALFLAAPLLASCATAPAGTPVAATAETERDAVVRAAETITAEDMARRIGVLADDSMLGRDTPSRELELAAEYIANEFREMGLEPAGDSATFIQRWPYDQVRLDPEGTRISLRGRDGGPRYGTDFFLIPGSAPRIGGPAYYAGGAGAVQTLGAEASGAVVLFDIPGASLSSEWQGKIGAAVGPVMQAGGAALVLVLDPEFPEALVGDIAPMVAGQQAPMPIVGLRRNAAEALFGEAGERLDASGAPRRVGDAVVEIEAAETRAEHRPPNVVGMVPGSDPVLKDTYVVLTAHFDHVGVGSPDATGDSIYNGADDNASGTSALMGIAQAFTALPERPARSVLFVAVSGEEKGLLGSMYFAKNPTVPAEGMIANVNMDMIGRNAPDTLIAIGQEYSTFDNILEQVLADHPDVGLTVIRDPYPEERLFFRSDQLSFIEQDIPALVFFSGLHDDYHKPSDEPGGIDADKAARVARLGFYIAQRVASSAEPPQWTEEGKREVEAILRSGGT